MRYPSLVLKLAIAATGLCAAFACSAQISKCIDADGRVTYSDNSCGNAVVVEYVIDSTPSIEIHPAPTPERVVAPMALENVPARETAWAHAPASQAHRSRDFATVGEARRMVIANDRSLAFLRNQKVASNP